MQTTPADAPRLPSRARAFSALFLIEMWERFGYYGMQVLLVVFMVEAVGFSEARANLTWGALAAMVYTTPVLGGWLGDRILGARRTMVLGAIALALGYGLLAVPWGMIGSAAWAHPLLFFSMGVIATANGIFKANPTNLISILYEGDRSQLDGAFTVYYMSVNIGSVLSQALTPWLSVRYGWHWAFLACSAGLLLGIAQYQLRRRLIAHIGSAPDFAPLRPERLAAAIGGSLLLSVVIAVILLDVAFARAIVWLGGIALLGLFAVLIARGGRGERSGLLAVLLLTAQVMLFFVFYQQMSTSLTLFALHNVRLDILGLHVPPEQFQILNPIWIAVFSPVLTALYAFLGRRHRDLSVAGKYAWGFALLALGFFVYAASGRFAVDGKVSAWWLVWGYLLQSVGELLISALGFAVLARYIRQELRGFMIGAYFLAIGISQYIGSYVANFASVPREVTNPVSILPLYMRLFFTLGWVAVAGLAVAVMMLPLLHRLDAVHGEASTAVGPEHEMAELPSE
jgi:POT family proton-dependent oligopeptide transporter